MKRLAFLVAVLLLSCAGSDGTNLILEGGFEKELDLRKGIPWSRPESQAAFMEIGETAHTGKKGLNIRTMPGQWVEVSQIIHCEPGREYRASVWVRGDSCEMHTGAWAPATEQFLGWNNSVVPGNEWKEAAFTFVCEPPHSQTKIYIAFRKMEKEAGVTIDDVRIVPGKR